MMKNILLFCTIALMLGACKEDKLDLYNGQNSIYFGEDAFDDEYRDTIQLSLVDYNIDTIVYPLKIRVLGDLFANIDRTYKIRMVSTTATPGVHFLPLKEEYVFKGDKENFTVLPLTFYRTLDLADTTFSIALELVSNEYFSLALPRRVVDAENEVYHDWTKQVIVFSCRILKPERWQEASPLGYFSEAKYLYINKSCGMVPSDWDNISVGKVIAIANFMKNFLNEKISKGWEAALKDPKGPKGYMGVSGVAIPDNFPDLTKK